MSLILRARRFALTMGALATVAALLASTVYASPTVQLPAAQGTDPAGPPAMVLTDTLWLWQGSQYGDGTSAVPDDPGRYTVQLMADGRLSLRADCNRGSGTYALDGSQLTLEPGALTKVACPPGTLDNVFLNDLRQVVSYAFAGQQLVLTLGADAGTMTFRQLAANLLVGPIWVVQQYNDSQGQLVDVLPTTEVTATFGNDGFVSGNAGCNLYRAAYTVAGSALTLGPAVSTQRACLNNNANAQEQAVLAALGATSTYALVDDQLTLNAADGTPQLVLVRPAIDPLSATPVEPAAE